MITSSAGLSGHRSRLSRLCGYAGVLIGTLLLALAQPAAWAQQRALLDPPGRVARLSLAEGAVSFAPANDTDWTPAVLNRPLTSGDRLWTAPRARAELHVGSTALRLNEQTRLDFLALDDSTAQLQLTQGTLQLHVRALFEGQRLEVDTPNLAFVISQPGDYRLDVSPANDTTRVVVQSGGGVIYGDNGAAVNLGSQQQANYTGTQLSPAAPGAAWQDSFDRWTAERDQLEDQSVSARYIPRETIGYQQLDAYGDWLQEPGYGAVWLPRAVPLNWAPYRVGHWEWIAPWGWTWVDDAPWGFAPFHYGRWAQIGLRWAWVPGRLAARPVYAPALVVFVGGSRDGVNWQISIGSNGLAQPGIGWFPLAPGEVFRPQYPVSPRYVTLVNQNIVVNNTVNVTPVYRYQHQPAAVTAVSQDDFSRGRPVRGNQHLLSATELSRAPLVAQRSALPQRPGRADGREPPRPVAPAAQPPTAVITPPLVGSRDQRRGDRPSENRNTPPAMRPAPAPEHSVIDAEQRAQREPQQGPRTLREPLPNNGSARPAMPEPQAAAERNAALQNQRAQQQQQRQREQQEQQRRQNEEAQGQRALREQAQMQQRQQRLDQAAQARQQQAQQPPPQPRVLQQDPRHQAHEPPLEPRNEPAQERQRNRGTDDTNANPLRSENAPTRSRER